MKNWIGLMALVLISFTACEKVIDVDLNDSNPQIVIQAELWSGTNDFSVKIDKTRSFYKNDAQEVVNDANVMLEEIGGGTQNLSSMGEGVYQLTNFTATEGKTYKLIVEYQEEIYEASSEMRPKVELDSVDYEFIPGIFGQPGGYFIFMNYTDPDEPGNYYRAYSWKNGEPQLTSEDFWLNDDEFTNGNSITIPLFTQFFELGDTVDIRFASIDASAYDYFITLSEVANGSGNSAAPANPNTNWSNHALGYFAALNADEVQLIIEE
jgi:hypothetical protein